MNVLIVGGNACGMSAASRLRRNLPDAKITVLEKGSYVSFGACGLPYFIEDEFSNSSEMIARSLEAFQKSGIDVLHNQEATELDVAKKMVRSRHTVTGEVQEFLYDKLLISTGAAPIIPPIEGISLTGVFTLTKMEDGVTLKRALSSAQNPVIIGGGFIGVETAEAFLKHGKNPVLIEKASMITSQTFEPEVSRLLQEKVIQHGVNLRLEESLKAIKGQEYVSEVQTDKGSYSADLVLLALGFRPQTAWLGGVLETLANGAIVIDSSGRTNIPDIFAGGDCATIPHVLDSRPRYIPLATGANKMGRILGDVLANKEAKFQGSLGSSGLRFMNFEAGRTGLSLKEALDAGYEAAQNSISDFNHTSYVKGRGEVYISLVYDKKSRIILGGQVCGASGSVLRTDILAVAVFKKMTVDELGFMDFVYSPPFARTWEALNIAGNTAK